MKFVILTYNSVGQDISNGWYNNVYIAQGFIRKTTDDPSGEDLALKAQTFDQLWQQRAQIKKEGPIDQWYIYCGKLPEYIVTKVSMALRPSEVTFLHCDCGWNPASLQNRALYMMGNSPWIKTSCGGVKEICQLFEDLKQGVPIHPLRKLSDTLKELRLRDP